MFSVAFKRFLKHVYMEDVGQNYIPAV